MSSSVLTAHFNRLRVNRNRKEWNANRKSEYPDNETLAYFDSRVFTIPDRTEVMNYFRWRQQDCIRNSVSMVAQSNFSHKELHGKSQSDMHEMLHNKGVNWATDFTDGEKNGRIILKETYEPTPVLEQVGPIQRTRWASKGAWVFTKDEGNLLTMIPKYE